MHAHQSGSAAVEATSGGAACPVMGADTPSPEQWTGPQHRPETHDTVSTPVCSEGDPRAQSSFHRWHGDTLTTMSPESLSPDRRISRSSPSKRRHLFLPSSRTDLSGQRSSHTRSPCSNPHQEGGDAQTAVPPCKQPKAPHSTDHPTTKRSAPRTWAYTS